MKRLVLLAVFLFALILSGCGHKTDIQYLIPQQDNSNTIEFDDLGYKGEAKYQITEAYITQAPWKDGINLDNIDEYTSIMYESSEGKIKEAHKDEFLDSEGCLEHGAVMYVLHIKFTNINAEYKHYKEEGFASPYVFRADNLFMNFIDDKGTAALSKTINYYSDRKEGDHTWSTFEAKPGETVEYEIGYIFGSIYRENGVNYNLNDYTPYISCMMAGFEQPAKQYQIQWEER